MDQETDEPARQTLATRKRESEGDSLNSGKASLSEGIKAVNVTHYRVGKYSYTNLDDAIAEHRKTVETRCRGSGGACRGTPPRITIVGLNGPTCNFFTNSYIQIA
jgi:hypothetical protein